MGLQQFLDEHEQAAYDLQATSIHDGSEVVRRQNEVVARCPTTAWFLGPKAEQGDLWESLLTYVFRDYVHWRRNYYPGDPVTITRSQKSEHEDWVDSLHSKLDQVLGELKAHFPFYSPRYIGHMLSEQTLPAVLGYFAGMLYNPNNVTAEAAPVTVQLELEAGKLISTMLGYDADRSWAHICSGGTVANLEALWVARLAQFAPFVAREICMELNWEFPMQAGSPPAERLLTEVTDKELLALPPSDSVTVFRRLARWAVEQHGTAAEKILQRINRKLEESEYSVSAQGYAAVAAKIGLKPVLFVSEAAHYSIHKAAEILGYGKKAVRAIPVGENFRISMEAFRTQLSELKEDEYLAGVIAIAGTTEEGSVDPVDQILAVREEMWKREGRSFWLHVDAAWGGYVTSLFRHCDGREIEDVSEFTTRLVEPWLESKRIAPGRNLSWDKPAVEKAMRAIREADSVTVDPHKMGYIPYPAGVVAFRSRLVTELIQQKAQYISDDAGGLKAVEAPVEITSVGPYTLEGSRPGAAASAVWLSHKMIPLCQEGHGKLIRDSLLAARTFWYYLTEHARWADDLAEYLGQPKSAPKAVFCPINEPDTNVVCFVVFPAARVDGVLHRTDTTLERLNQLNQAVYSKLSLQQRPTYRGMTRAYSYSQPFFVSRTWISPDQYQSGSVRTILQRFGLSEKEYNEQGLFVLRSTVMNPLLLKAQEQGTDYLLEFLLYLHTVASEVLGGASL